jgi:hypothetical protein
MGGIDYAGLPLVAALLGFGDVERLLQQLLVIKAHKPHDNEDE